MTRQLSTGRSARARLVAERLHSAAIHLLRGVRKVDEATGLSSARMSALSVIVYAGPISLGELAAAEQVSPPTLSRLVTGLEKAGLTRRVESPVDRRSILIRATPKGVRVLRLGRERRIDVLAEHLKGLPRS